MRGNWLLVGWACSEIGCSLAGHSQKLVTRLLSIWGNSFVLVLNHVFSPVIRSPVPFSRPLSNVLWLLSQVSVSCLPSSVPCLTSLFLLCSLSPVLVLYSMSHFFVPCLRSSVPNLTYLILVSHSLSQILSLCSLYPILLSRQFVVLYWFRVCSACDEIVSEYAQHAMKFFPCMLSMR